MGNMYKYLCIDIGGTNIKSGLFDKSGNLIEKKVTYTPESGVTDFIKKLDDIVEPFVSQIWGIAISVPGKVNSEKGIVYHGGSLHYLDKFNFKHVLQDKYNIPVEIENDGRAATLSEIWRGSMHNVDNGAVIILGTGVGGGIIANGKLLRGFHDQAGEISFMTLGNSIADKDIVGKLCSSVSLVEACSYKLGIPDKLDGIKVFDAINDADMRILPIFKHYCATIAAAILNIHSVIDLQKVAIGGGISSQPVLIKQIKEEFQTGIVNSPKIASNIELPEIVATTFLSDANLYGGLYNFLNKQTEHEGN